MIILDSRNPAGPSSYAPSLSLWQNLEIRLAKNVRYCVMVIDDAVVIKGDLLGSPPSPLSVNNTVAINDTLEAQRITKWFSTIWIKAPKFSFDPNSLK